MTQNQLQNLNQKRQNFKGSKQKGEERIKEDKEYNFNQLYNFYLNMIINMVVLLTMLGSTWSYPTFIILIYYIFLTFYIFGQLPLTDYFSDNKIKLSIVL